MSSLQNTQTDVWVYVRVERRRRGGGAQARGGTYHVEHSTFISELAVPRMSPAVPFLNLQDACSSRHNTGRMVVPLIFATIDSAYSTFFTHVSQF